MGHNPDTMHGVQMMMKLEIVNLVATGDLKQQVDLLKLSKLRNVDFDKNIYGGKVAYLKTENMFGKVSIFSSGKLISVGSKSYGEAKADLENSVDILVKNGLIKPINIDVKLRNIVALLQEPYQIDLEILSNSEQVIYEPEQFPGAILKQNDPKVTYLIFASGKIIISGAKSIEDLHVAANNVREISKKYS